MRRTASIAALVAAAVALTAPPGATAAAPKVSQLVVFRSGEAVQRTVSTAAARVRVGGKLCAAGERTPLAALARGRIGGLRVRDFGSCGARPRDSASMIVTRLRSDRNRGQRGWVYKVGRRAGSAGPADMTGPFGRGRLRAGQRVTWFYCVRATDCQRTLELRAAPAAGGITATVHGYDDLGQGIPIEGAGVTASGVTAVTGPDGSAQLALPPGTHRVVARKDGLVRSFSERVELP